MSNIFKHYYRSLSFPDFVKSKDFRDLASKMLEKNQLKRLSNFDKIKSHPWFRDFKFVR